MKKASDRNDTKLDMGTCAVGCILTVNVIFQNLLLRDEFPKMIRPTPIPKSGKL